MTPCDLVRRAIGEISGTGRPSHTQSKYERIGGRLGNLLRRHLAAYE